MDRTRPNIPVPKLSNTSITIPPLPVPSTVVRPPVPTTIVRPPLPNATIKMPPLPTTTITRPSIPVPTIIRPSVPVPNATITRPSIPVPTIIRPHIPVPTITRPSVPVPNATIIRPHIPVPTTTTIPSTASPNIFDDMTEEEIRQYHALFKKPDAYSPTETFVDIVIAEQDADIMEEKEYLGYVKYLLNDESKYDIFSRIFPDNTCGNILFRMKTETSEAPTIYPNTSALINCIREKETTGRSVAINFSYNNHANLLWVDTVNKIINRYDPQVPMDRRGQSTMDMTIGDYFEYALPEYVYIGNTLENWQCVQSVRGEGRSHKSDYYCQDYSLLYAINRINGMSHEEASFDLVSRGDDILVDLAELLRALSYKIRDEINKPIPDRFRNWRR